MMASQATCSLILLTLVVVVLILGACTPAPLARPEGAMPTPSAAPPGPSVADLLRHPPAPGATVEVDAYPSRGGAPVFPSPYPPPDQVRCPDSHNAILTDRPFPAVLHLLNGSQTNTLPDDAPWLVATTPEATQPGAHTEPQLPYHARLRGHLGNPAFVHCPHADRILVVEDVVAVYAEEPPEPSAYRLQLPDDAGYRHAAWPRYRDAALGYSLPHPPDWTIEPLAEPDPSTPIPSQATESASGQAVVSAIALRAPQWPDYPVVMRVHAGETHHNPYSSSRPPLLQGGGLGLFEQDWVFGEESTTTQHLAGYRVDRTAGPGERAVSVLFSAHGRTYELALHYPTGLDASQPLLTAYSTMVEGFRLDVPPGPTPTPPVKQTLGAGPFLSHEEVLAHVRELTGQAVELLDARLMSEAEARFGGQMSLCSTFMGHPDGVWVLTVRGVFEGTPRTRTMRLLLDATTGETLCGEEINPEATPYATMPPGTTATPVPLVSPTATPAPYPPPAYPTPRTPRSTTTPVPYPLPETPTWGPSPTPSPTIPPTLTPTASPTPLPTPTLIPTVDAAVLPDQLRSAITLRTEEGPGGHSLWQVTGWDYGMRSSGYCQGPYRWLDNAHLLLYPKTGEEEGMGIIEWTMPVVVDLNSGETWLPAMDSPTSGCDSPLWSELQVLISTQGEETLLFDADGTVVQRYPGGGPLYLSPSGRRLLVGFIWRDLETGRAVDFSGQHKRMMWNPAWSSDETRLFDCCFGFADANSGRYGYFDLGELQPVGRCGSPGFTSLRSQWVLNDTRVMVEWDFYDGGRAVVPLIDPQNRTYEDLLVPTQSSPSAAEVRADPVRASWPGPQTGNPLTAGNPTKVNAAPGNVAAAGGPSTLRIPRIAPDGEHIMMGHQPIYLIDLRTFTTRAITDDLQFASWSPDSRFALLRAEGDGYWLLPTTGGDLYPLAETSIVAPTWNSQGGHLAFLVEEGRTLVVLDVAIHATSRVSLPGPFARIFWRLQGDGLAVLAADGSLWWIAGPAVDHVEQLTPPLPSVRDVSWSPDGGHLAFVSGADVYVVSVYEAEPGD